MTASQLRAALRSLDISQAELARLFGRSTRAVHYWIAGDRAIPPEAWILVGLMLDGKITLDDLRLAKKIDRAG